MCCDEWDWSDRSSAAGGFDNAGVRGRVGDSESAADFADRGETSTFDARVAGVGRMSSHGDDDEPSPPLILLPPPILFTSIEVEEGRPNSTNLSEFGFDTMRLFTNG